MVYFRFSFYPANLTKLLHQAKIPDAQNSHANESAVDNKMAIIISH